jgi:hypothetical protein
MLPAVALSRRSFLLNASTSAAAATLASSGLAQAEPAMQPTSGPQLPDPQNKVQAALADPWRKDRQTHPLREAHGKLQC